MRSKKSSNSRPRSTIFQVHWHGELQDYITALAWSPSGDYLAVSSASGEVVVWSETDLVSLLPAQPDSTIDCLGFSANGKYLAAAGQQGDVFLWQTSALNQPPTVLQNPHCWIDQLTWHPGVSWLAFGAGNQIQVRDCGSSQSLTCLDFKDSSVLALKWHPDGTLLATSGHTGVKVWQSTDWEAEPEFVEVPGASISVDWSLDGRYLASGNLDRTLTVVSWGNPPPWLMQGFPGKVRQVAWAAPMANQPSLVAAACVEGVTVWQRQGQGWENRVLAHHEGTVVAIAFHPTQRLLASAAQDGQLCLWKNAKSLQQTLKGVASGFSAIAWHPQGTYLAAGGDQGELLIWKPTNRGQGFQ
ncbi:WD40 repeat domain-containing protein [Leptothoe spongobia TAU-MAC 1115]|uniref:WD40 repeat domain-containing protein n=2 Tax=Leptothoe TaxID=2651725 RepID=A0A947DL88_9CYAN|nr:WD40 repeat domain-containing protein [Leptothoe spongobia TAU-MAC 1115]